MCFFFCVWKRGEVRRKCPGREQNQEKSLFFDIEVPRAFYSPDMLYEAAALIASGPSRVATSEASQMGLILKPLERY